MSKIYKEFKDLLKEIRDSKTHDSVFPLSGTQLHIRKLKNTSLRKMRGSTRHKNLHLSETLDTPPTGANYKDKDAANYLKCSALVAYLNKKNAY